MARLVAADSGMVFEVPPGETTVGRGPLLKITDQRVSRNHAVLEWKNGNLKLCPRHHNPCFLKSAGESEYSALVRDQWAELHHGDHIALLPTALCYRVEVVTESEQQQEEEEEEGRREESSETASHEDNSTAALATPPLSVDEGKESGRGNSVATMTNTGRKRTLPTWLSDISTSSTGGTSKTAAPRGTSKAVATGGSSKKAATGGASKTATQKGKKPAAQKRAVHKPAGHRAAVATPSQETGSASPSAASPAVDDGTTWRESGSEDSSPPVKTARLTVDSDLPPCPYGADCYRKNRAHFREYSHPSKDDRPECPYGTDCYRKNPDHRRNFKHSGPPTKPSSQKPSHQTRTTTRKTKRVSALAGDSDESETPNTYDYNDSFIDDEASSDSTSYGGESEDSDWAPAGPGGEGEGREEEVGELIDEAKEFMSNKKMWKP